MVIFTAFRETVTGKGLAFRWTYILLPLAVLLLSIILAIYFYPRLPDEVATHFRPDGTPTRLLSQGMSLAWLLAPQLFLILIATGTTWGITKIGLLSQPAADSGIRPQWILQFMGNAFALPQLVLFLVMLDIFSYNSYQVHIMPLWASVFIVVGLATVIFATLLAMLIARARKQFANQPDQTKEQ
ncbi:MAG TPA: DUF1648 domain-containing protein [Dehalococcoidia bacterium]|nr:DUF1648 domain-containing protein [Dehalococcoidia bacterium]